MELTEEARKRIEAFNQALTEDPSTVRHKLAAYMAAFLQGKNGRPEPPYQKLTEDDIQDIVEGNQFFDVVENAAYDLMIDEPAIPKKEIQRATEELDFYGYQHYENPHERLEDLFHDPIPSHAFHYLNIHLEATEARIPNFHGKLFQPEPNPNYHGEKAYRFLVALNETDKRQSAIPDNGIDKTVLTIRYGDYTTGRLELAIGAYAFGNRTNLADALQYRLKTNSASGYREPPLTQDFLRSFQEEETSYLFDHPELAAVNRRRGPVSYYLCKEQNIPLLEQNYIRILDRPSAESLKGAAILDMKDQLAYWDLFDRLKAVHETKDPIAEANTYVNLDRDLLPGWTLIACQETPAQMMSPDPLNPYTTARNYLQLVIPPKDRELLNQAQNISGLAALLRLAKEDAAEAMTAERRQIYIPRRRPSTAALFYKDTLLYKKTYVPGTGDLAKDLNRYLPPIDNPEIRRQVEQIYDTLSHYSHKFPNRYQYGAESMLGKDFHLPNKETSAKNLPKYISKPQKERYSSKDAFWMSAATKYYMSLGAIQSGTPYFQPEAMEEAAKALVQDGYDARRIKTIARHAPEYQSGLCDWEKIAEEVLSRPEIKKQIRELKKSTGR